MNTEKREYELAFLLKNKEEGVVDVLLNQYSGEIFYRGPVAELRLAYPIQKQKQAYFGYVHFRISSEAIKTLVDSLQLHPAVLRVLVITPPFTKKKEEKPYRTIRKSKVMSSPANSGEMSPRPVTGGLLTNEALEKQLEEILK